MDNVTASLGVWSFCSAISAVGSADMLAAPLAEAQKDLPLTAAARAFMTGDSPASGPTLVEPLSPYQQSLWVYRCVSEIQKTAAGIPLRLMTASDGVTLSAKSSGQKWPTFRRVKARSLRPVHGRKAICVGKAADGEMVESGEAYDLLARPNRYQDWPEFIRALVGHYLLAGKAAILLTDLQGLTQKPSEMHVVSGRHITPVFASDERGLPILMGYQYRAPKSGRELAFTPDEVKYFHLWSDSENPYDAVAPSMPGRLAIATEYAASLFNASAFGNNAEPGMTISFPGRLSDPQRDQFKAALRQRHGGPANARRELVLEGGATATPYQTTFSDLQFDQGKKTNRLEICCLYGVPPAVAGWVDAAGDSSAYTSNALKQYYQQTIFPLLDGLIPAIQEIVSRIDSGLAVYFDVEDQPVVQEMRLSRMESAVKFFSMGYPPNAINAMLDLGMPELPWGDTGFLPTGMASAADIASGNLFGSGPVNEVVGNKPPPDEPDDEPPTDDTPDEPKPGKTIQADPGAILSKSVADRIWSSWMASWAPLARTMNAAIRKRLVVQERRLLTALKANLLAPGKTCGTAAPGGEVKDSGLVARILLEVFGDSQDKAAWRVRVAGILRDSANLGLRQALVEAGITGEQLEATYRRLMSLPRLGEILSRETVRVATRIDDTTRALLKRQLSAGLEAGEDYRKLADRVQGVMGNNRSRAIMQARNAVGQTLSIARHEGHLASGMTHKIWIHSRGPGLRRPSHVAAESVYRSAPVPIDQPFMIDGYALMYPRDPSGPPEEIINCQCLQIARRLSPGKASDWSRSEFVGADAVKTSEKTTEENDQ